MVRGAANFYSGGRGGGASRGAYSSNYYRGYNMYTVRRDNMGPYRPDQQRYSDRSDFVSRYNTRRGVEIPYNNLSFYRRRGPMPNSRRFGDFGRFPRSVRGRYGYAGGYVVRNTYGGFRRPGYDSRVPVDGSFKRSRGGARGGRGRGRGRGRGGRGGTSAVNESALDAQLDEYMGTDATKNRLDNQLDAYFGRAAGEATTSVVKPDPTAEANDVPMTGGIA